MDLDGLGLIAGKGEAPKKCLGPRARFLEEAALYRTKAAHEDAKIKAKDEPTDLKGRQLLHARGSGLDAPLHDARQFGEVFLEARERLGREAIALAAKAEPRKICRTDVVEQHHEGARQKRPAARKETHRSIAHKEARLREDIRVDLRTRLDAEDGATARLDHAIPDLTRERA